MIKAKVNIEFYASVAKRIKLSFDTNYLTL